MFYGGLQELYRIFYMGYVTASRPFKEELKRLNNHCYQIIAFSDHDWMNTEPWYILNNFPNFAITDHWAPPYYAQAAFGMISYCLHNVN